METKILRISGFTPDKSVLCILGDNKIPDFLELSKAEKEFALTRIKAKDEYVFINSYNKCTYLVMLKEGHDHNKVREQLRRTAYNLCKQIKAGNHSDLVITSSGSYREAIADFTEGFLLSIYKFTKYRTQEEKNGKGSYPSALLLKGDLSDQDINWLIAVTESVYFTRNLISEPPNQLNAVILAEEIKKLGSAAGFNVEILNKGKIEALKMGGLLAVNRGSVDPPSFSILEWRPENFLNSRPIVLVGKGVVYDTGGLNLKTGDYMDGMKGDMAGAATVAGIFNTAARTGIPLHLIGLIPSTDNRPGGNAYTQGDIITMFNKLTVEIGNTDAEGRLILADAISYASKYNPELIIDIATLTGSAAMTFSNQAIALMTNADRKYIDLLEQSGNEVYERVGQLPFWEEYGDFIKSDVADLKNVGGREAGAITAGKFLERFSEHPLIHLDIAGTSMMKKDDFYRSKDGSGSGLRLLTLFLKKLAGTYPEKNK